MSGSTLLILIWSVSALLAAVSLGTMVALIVRRAITDRQERRKAVRQKAIRKIVFDYLDHRADTAVFLESLTPTDVADIRDTVEDLIRMVRGPARDRLRRLIAELGGSELFLEVLRDGTEEERLRAVSSLGLFEDPFVAGALTGALDDPSPRIRLAAARSLVELGIEPPVRDLMEKLDVGKEIRPRGMREIARELASRHKQEMLDLLRSDASDTTRMLMLYGLSGLRDPRLVGELAAQYDSPSEDVRATVLRALTALGHPDAAPTVARALADPSWPVRAQAAVSAGTIGLPETMEALVDLVDDEHWWVRFRAAHALAQLGDKGRAALEGLAVRRGRAAEMASAMLAELGIA